MSPSDRVAHSPAPLQSAASPGLGSDLPNGRDPQTLAEAAKEFESVLVRQFVEVMTKDMFTSSLAGENGPGWMKSQRGTQRDMMTDMLTDHLVESGALSISEQLMKKWGASSASSSPAESPLQESMDLHPASPIEPPRQNPMDLRPAPSTDSPLQEPVDPRPASPTDTPRPLTTSHIDHVA